MVCTTPIGLNVERKEAGGRRSGFGMLRMIVVTDKDKRETRKADLYMSRSRYKTKPTSKHPSEGTRLNCR